MKLLYASEAIGDLERLREFIAEKNPAAAQRISRELLKGIQNLKQFPQLGVGVPRAPDPKRVRDLVIDRYVVRYLVLDAAIYVLRIWHHREDRALGR